MAKRKKKIADRKLVPEIQKIGVYAIHNKKNNKYYVGSSINVYTRLLTQCTTINSTGLNMRILEDIINKNYDFEFLVLETFENGTITDKELRDKEYYYMKKYDSMENGYNINYPWETGKFKNGQKLVCPIKEIKVKKKIDTKERYKKQNDKTKDNYDRISVTLPKGMKEEIKTKTGKSINALVNELIKRELEKYESDKVPF